MLILHWNHILSFLFDDNLVLLYNKKVIQYIGWTVGSIVDSIDLIDGSISSNIILHSIHQ